MGSQINHAPTIPNARVSGNLWLRRLDNHMSVKNTTGMMTPNLAAFVIATKTSTAEVTMSKRTGKP
jgi:hypothetical protein